MQNIFLSTRTFLINFKNSGRLRNILIINQDSGYLMIDIANALSNKNIKINLITGRLVTRNISLAKSIKIKTIARYHRSNKFRRVMSWIIGFFQISFLIKTKYRKDYLFIVSNPPFTTFLPLFCKNRFSLMIYDVFPDTITQMGLLSENSFLVRYWKKANRIVFPKADNIFTLSESMASRIETQSKNKKISIIPIWSDNEFFKPISKNLNPFIAKHNLRNKFVVLYSGNLGATHNVEIIPELASLVNEPDIIFVIIGDGDRRKWLDAEILKRGLENCISLPLQPVEVLNYSFASADLAIVTLGTTSSGLSVPSKTFNFMSAGLPLLCVAGNDSELDRLVTKYSNGKCYPPDQIDQIVSFIKELSKDPAQGALLKTNSLKASFDFTPQNAEIIAEAICRSLETN